MSVPRGLRLWMVATCLTVGAFIFLDVALISNTSRQEVVRPVKMLNETDYAKTQSEDGLLPNDDFARMARRILSNDKDLGEELDVLLFIIWNGAYKKRLNILKDISLSFVPLDITEYDWEDTLKDDNDLYQENFLVLHGASGDGQTALPPDQDEKGAQYGSFTSVVVADINPHFLTEKRGNALVTVNARAKEKMGVYSAWCGSGLVYVTPTALEANYDIRMIFYQSPLALLHRAVERRLHKRDIITQFLRHSSSFKTDRQLFVVRNPAYETLRGWTCDAFMLVLNAFPQMYVEALETRTLLFRRVRRDRRNDKMDQHYPIVEGDMHVSCVSWPPKIRIKVDETGMEALGRVLGSMSLRKRVRASQEVYVLLLEGTPRMLSLETMA
ncbi:hypothetical protein TRVL_05153 [Trypanosoma vivax]|nr:hypothetical protein TRVL_05153 [Trypanosoma vivax]